MYDTTKSPATSPAALEARSCGAGAGLTWFTRAWKIFANAWLELLIATIIVCVIAFDIGLIPGVSLLQSLVYPLLIAGFLHMAQKSEHDEVVSIGDLFVAFNEANRSRLIKLLLMGLLSVAAMFVIMIAMAVIAAVAYFLLGGAAFFEGIQQNWMQAGMAGLTGTEMLVVLLAVVLFASVIVVYSCAFWLATPLLWFTECGVFESLKLSLQAAGRNVGALLVFGFVLLIAFVVALLPFALGLLVFIPVSWVTLYTVYKDVFEQESFLIMV